MQDNNYTDVDLDFLADVGLSLKGLQEVFKPFHENVLPDKATVEYFAGYIDRNRATLTDSQKNSLSFGIGCLLGEVLIKQYSGRWIFNEGDSNNPCLILGGDSLMAFPIQKVYRNIENGKEDSIYDYFLNTETALKIAKKEYTESETMGIKTFHLNR